MFSGFIKGGKCEEIIATAIGAEPKMTLLMKKVIEKL